MALRVGLPCWLDRKRLKLPSFYRVIPCALLWCKPPVSSPSTSWFPELWAKWPSLLNELPHLGFYVTITENGPRQRVIWHWYTLQRNQKNFLSTYFVSMFGLNPNVNLHIQINTAILAFKVCVCGGGLPKTMLFLHLLFSSILLLLDRMFSAGISQVQDTQRKKNEFCSTRPHANARAQ